MATRPTTEENPLARAKSTHRAAARRRYRAAQAETRGFSSETDDLEGEPDSPLEAPEATSQRGLARFVRLPRVRDDLRALPGLFRSRRLLWLPFLLLLLAVPALLVEVTDPSLEAALGYFGGFMLGPSALAPAFLAGFLAPRAAYLIGGLVGLLNGLLTMALVGVVTSRAQDALALRADASIGIIGYCTVLGIAFGAFAAWYRRFLQSSTARRRAAAEARARSQRRESRRQPRQATR